MYYPDGDAVQRMPRITDLSDLEMKHGTDIGHMMPLYYHGQAAGVSYLGRRELRDTQVEATITEIVNGGIWAYEIDLLTRCFDNTETQIGSAGYSVPFVAGGSGNVDYVPPAYSGETFDSTHNHFINNNDWYNCLDRSAQHLVEHGHMEPFIALVGYADMDNYRNNKNFVDIVNPMIQMVDQAGRTSEPRFINRGSMTFSETGAYGFMQTAYGLVELRASQRIPTTYGFVFKSYGNNSMRNPLCVRLDPSDGGFGMYIIPNRSTHFGYPIESLNILFNYGIGVGMDRTNGVAFRKNTANYAVPTIT